MRRSIRILLPVSFAVAIALLACGGMVETSTAESDGGSDAHKASGPSSCPTPGTAKPSATRWVTTSGSAPSPDLVPPCPPTPPENGSTCKGITGICGWFYDGCGWINGECVGGVWGITSPCSDAGPPDGA